MEPNIFDKIHEIDLKNPSSNHHNAGFSDQERNKMTELLSHGYIDTFRYLYPDKKDQSRNVMILFHKWQLLKLPLYEHIEKPNDRHRILSNH